MYKINLKSFKIEKVEVESQTPKFVILTNGEKYKLDGNNFVFFENYEEAVICIKDEITKEFYQTVSRLEYLSNILKGFENEI